MNTASEQHATASKDVKGRSSAETTYELLLNALRDGGLRPGDRVREEELAERLDVSRTPIREALRRLEADGIVEHRPRSGAVIRQLSHTEVVELYEMRVVLERTAAMLAAQHGVEAEFDRLNDLNEMIANESANSDRAASFNQQFHKGLYLAGRNRFLQESARALNNSLLLLGPTTLTDEHRIEVVVDQHQRIVDALKKRDAEAAGSAAEIHLQTSLKARIHVLGQ